MIFNKKTWVDRSAEFPGRRNLKDILTGETMTVDVTRNEGNVAQAGDAFSAETMNDLETRIEDAFTGQDDVLTGTVNVVLPASGWSGSAPYTQFVQVSGFTNDDRPIIQCDGNPNTREEKKNLLKQWGFIDSIEVSERGITATCKFDKPAVNIPIVIKGR